MIDRWNKVETYRVIRELRATNKIDEDTHTAMLSALEITQSNGSILLHEGEQTINITLV